MEGADVSYCKQCGANVGGARYCGQCGARVESGPTWAHQGKSAWSIGEGFKINELGTLAYLTPIPALALLVLEPYRRNIFIRFHSYQCLFLTLAAIVLSVFLSLGAIMLSVLLPIFSVLGFLGWLISAASQLLLVSMWAFAAYKAWHGVQYRVPLIGALAARHAYGN